MNNILSFGAGIQTTALVILIAEKKLEVDAVVFADTGSEKPETYSFIESYTKPILESVGVPYIVIKNELPNYKGNIYDFYWSKAIIPSIRTRNCSDHFKKRPIHKFIGKNCTSLIGFSTDESQRAKGGKNDKRRFPLIEMNLSVYDCRDIIKNYGLPIPLKSSCYFCLFQPVIEWNWLKNHHPELFQKAIDLEAHYHERRPDMKNIYGLLRGTPLWKMKEGLQPEMLAPGEYSCWEGHCGH
jgi:hypothetical protein